MIHAWTGLRPTAFSSSTTTSSPPTWTRSSRRPA